MSLAQVPKGNKIAAVVAGLKNIIEAEWVDVGSKRKLKSFLQAAAQVKEDEDDDLSLTQPQAKQVAYESSSGGIVKTVEEMQGKAEDTLSDLRKKEMSDAQEFAMLEQGLKSEISHGGEKLSTAKKSMAANAQAKEEASGKLVETQKSKAADEEYASTLKTECESKASEWEARQKSAAEEMGAIEKAKQILVEGVTAFAQVASMATSDPFVKIRGLIEDMIAKLLKEAEE